MEPLAIFGGQPAVCIEEPPLPLLRPATVAALHTAVDCAARDWAWLSGLAGSGPVAELEEAFAAATCARYALALSSGTAALFTALLACGIRPGDEVIVPAYTWGQTAAAVLHAGAVPVYADIEPETYTLAPGAVEACLTPRTRALIAVHLYGHPADMPALLALARRHHLRVIEDSAHAFGASIDGRPVSSWGDIGCFSLGRAKPVTGGEGGLLTTRSARLYEEAVRLTQHPIRQKYALSGKRRATIGEFGYNFRIHPLAAVIAVSELREASAHRERRASVYAALESALKGIPGIRPARERPGHAHAWYRYCPTYVPSEVAGGSVPRAIYIAALQAEGVPLSTDPIGIPLHHRPGSGSSRRRRETCSAAAERCERVGLAFPAWMGGIAAEPVLNGTRRAFEKVAAHAVFLAGFSGQSWFDTTQRADPDRMLVGSAGTGRDAEHDCRGTKG